MQRNDGCRLFGLIAGGSVIKIISSVIWRARRVAVGRGRRLRYMSSADGCRSELAVQPIPMHMLRFMKRTTNKIN